MIIRIFLSFVFALIGSAQAWACSCVGIENKRVSDQIYGDLIFVGRPIHSRYEKSNLGWDNDVITTFEIDKTLKGKASQTIEIYHGQNGASCGVQFVLGHVQIISAHKAGDIMQTGLCSNPLPEMLLIDFMEKKSNPILKSSSKCFETGGLIKSDDPAEFAPWRNAKVIDPECSLHVLEGKQENLIKWEAWVMKNINSKPGKSKTLISRLRSFFD